MSRKKIKRRPTVRARRSTHLNGWTIFKSECIAEMRTSQTGPFKLHEATKFISAKWKQLSSIAKKHYQDIAQMQKEQHRTTALACQAKQKTMLQTRCSPGKFLKAVQKLTDSQKEAIGRLGFGGLLNLRCSVLRRELCSWLVSIFDPTTCSLKIGENILKITVEHVSLILGLPSTGFDIVTTGRGDDIAAIMECFNVKKSGISVQELESTFYESGTGDRFCRAFILFSLGVLLCPAANSHVSVKYLHSLKDIEAIKSYNWSKLILQRLCEEITLFRNGNKHSVGGCLIFLKLLYYDQFHVGATIGDIPTPRLLAWGDKEIKQREEMEKRLGGYGHGKFIGNVTERSQKISEDERRDERRPLGPILEDLRNTDIDLYDHIMSIVSTVQRSDRNPGDVEECAHKLVDHVVHTYGARESSHEISTGRRSTSSTRLSPSYTPNALHYEVHPFNIDMTSPPTDNMANVGSPFMSSMQESNILHQDIELRDKEPDVEHPNADLGKRPKRMRARSRHLRTPYLIPNKHSPIKKKEKCLLEYVRLNDEKKDEILWRFNGMHLTRNDLNCLQEGNPVSSFVVDAFIKGLDRQGPGKSSVTRHVFPTSFSDSIKSSKRLDIENLVEYFDPEKLGYKLNDCDLLFVPICHKWHWFAYVVNQRDRRIEVLDSMVGGVELRRRPIFKKMVQYIEEILQHLSICDRLMISSWPTYVADVPHQGNGLDCGVFMLRFLEYWDGRSLIKQFSQENITYLRERITVDMVLANINEERGRLLSTVSSTTCR